MKISRVLSIPSTLEAGDVLLLKESVGVRILVVNKDGTAALPIDERVCLDGPSELYYTEQGVWTIQAYTDRVTYTASSSDGTVAISDGKVYFTVTNTALSVASFTVNDRVFTIVMKAVTITRPSILSPIQNAVNVSVNSGRLIASEFSLNFGSSTDFHTSSDWEVSTDPDFTNVVASSYQDKLNLTAWTITG